MTARAIAAEEVAKIVANADTNFDTLKEIADWIVNDTIGAAQMANDIAELKSSATSVNTRLETLEDNLDDAESNINTLSGTINALSASVIDNYVTNAVFGDYKTAVTADIATAKGEAISAASAYTVAQVNAEAEARQDADDALDSRISKLEKLSGATSSAVQTIEVENSASTKITVTKVDTKVTFNFDNMVIDGGTF
jgi:predicted  nucleic acid-binding Zn-ribbon protein